MLDKAGSQSTDSSAGIDDRMTVITTDVVVAGLGPAGASAALTAAQLGLSVIGVDRKNEPGTPVQCAEFVPRFPLPSVESSREAACQMIDAMRTFVETQPADVQHEFPGVMIDRARFDAALVTRAMRHGADCRFGTAIHRFDRNGRLVLNGGTGIEGRVIIAADGPRSRVGQTLGLRNKEMVAARQLGVELIEPHAATDIFLNADYVGGYGWLFPRGSVANIGIGVVPEVSAELKQLLERLHTSLADQGRVGRTIFSRTGGMIPVGGITATRHRVEDTLVVFCGDAAGLTNPITGAGINAAVQSGHLAGEAAASFIAGDDRAGDDYDEELRDVFGPSLSRAYAGRAALMRAYSRNAKPTDADLRASWIAYPEYWAA